MSQEPADQIHMAAAERRQQRRLAAVVTGLGSKGMQDRGGVLVVQCIVSDSERCGIIGFKGGGTVSPSFPT